VTRATHAVNTDLGHGIPSRVPVAWEKIRNDLNLCAVEEKHSEITHNTLAIGMYNLVSLGIAASYAKVGDVKCNQLETYLKRYHRRS
jgi:hypothetical protein